MCLHVNRSLAREMGLSLDQFIVFSSGGQFPKPEPWCSVLEVGEGRSHAPHWLHTEQERTCVVHFTYGWGILIMNSKGNSACHFTQWICGPSSSGLPQAQSPRVPSLIVVLTAFPLELSKRKWCVPGWEVRLALWDLQGVGISVLH